MTSLDFDTLVAVSTATNAAYTKLQGIQDRCIADAKQIVERRLLTELSPDQARLVDWEHLHTFIAKAVGLALDQLLDEAGEDVEAANRAVNGVIEDAEIAAGVERMEGRQLAEAVAT